MVKGLIVIKSEFLTSSLTWTLKEWAKNSNLSSILGVSIGCSQTEACELSFFCSWLLLCFCLFGKPFEGEKAASRCCDKCGAREPVSALFFALSIHHTIPPNFSDSPEFPDYFPVSLTVSASSFQRLQEPKRCVREGRGETRYGVMVCMCEKARDISTLFQTSFMNISRSL